MSLQVYTQRPDGTSLWLPIEVASALGIARVVGAAIKYANGRQLTEKQFRSTRIQDLLARRSEKKGATEDQASSKFIFSRTTEAAKMNTTDDDNPFL
jgi:hypothetical protein